MRSSPSIMNGESVSIHLLMTNDDTIVTFAVDNLKKEHNLLSQQIGKRIKESKGQDKCEVRIIYTLRPYHVGREAKVK